MNTCTRGECWRDRSDRCCVGCPRQGACIVERERDELGRVVAEVEGTCMFSGKACEWRIPAPKRRQRLVQPQQAASDAAAIPEGETSAESL